ncbi:MAG: dihydrolipoyl dehydrogenase [Neisseriaceae bacterium]|nr:dihydrolipoyl dehydrogenase [Neisseriaceae bacterium]
MKTIHTDVAIIGGGTAGMSAFRAARRHTDKVLLIEDNHFGTTCARVGCMPSKLLISAANARHNAQHTDLFGIRVQGEVQTDGKAVMQRVKAERDRFVGFVLSDINDFPDECKLLGRATFQDEHTLIVNNNNEITEVHFERAVIATGSRPAMVADWLKLGDKLIVNDDVFNWDTLPESVAVFGTGVIGLELGQALHRLGVKVYLFGQGGFIGSITDPVVLKKAQDIFNNELEIHFDKQTVVQLNSQNKVEIQWQDNKIEVDYLLAAIGRTPNTDNIGLENLNIERNARGVPVADPLTMQTSLPHIFIAGDSSAQVPLLHEAADQGKIAGENAGTFPNINKGLRRSGVNVIFSEPQIMSAGERWVNLKDRADEIVIGEVSFDNQGRSRVMGINSGHMRIYADKQTGRFLGAEMVGPAAEHIAHLLAWAHQAKMTIPQMLDMPFYHPVIEEGVRTALRDAMSKFQAA